ncbi:MAG: M48 family metallopeptidase [Candidatus Omnitrophica bacterium]|nr:M48 family metallopeptidase [Candidatus Omnitrophota bacterium]
MNMYLVVILSILIVHYGLDLIVEILNVRHVCLDVPQEFRGYYDDEKYRRSQKYLKDRTVFSLVSSGFFLAVTIAFILTGGFNWIDQWARGFGQGSIVTGLIFAAALFLGLRILHIPFSLYSTFVIEEKYGFNRTTAKTFVTDFIKDILLTAVFGSAVFIAVVWFFESTGRWGWLYCWGFLVLYELFYYFIYPVAILPLFNKFIPLEEGELKTQIEEYARDQRFALAGIFTMDGSRRSAKSNAFFTGFGKFRRIALFDTLIKQHTTEELVSVLAHEIGHYKKKHILKHIGLSILSMGLMLYVLSFLINNPGLFSAFAMEQFSVYASLFFFGFLYAPISFVLGIMTMAISRRHEYQADRFAVMTYKKPQAMIDALKKLTVDNLSNLTPHPAKVFLEYSHPPVLKRIEAIKNINIGEIQ